MSRIVNRRSVMAALGVTAGIASAAAFTAAPVQAAEPGSGSGSSADVIKVPAPAPALNAEGTCFSWTDVAGFLGNTPVTVHVPTTGPGNNVRDCLLVQGNETDGVYKVQDAINRCYPQFSAGVGFDGRYLSNTTRAVRQIQQAVGVTVDGKYGAETKTAMQWPAYRGNGTFAGCGLLRV